MFDGGQLQLAPLILFPVGAIPFVLCTSALRAGEFTKLSDLFFDRCRVKPSAEQKRTKRVLEMRAESSTPVQLM